MKLCAVIFPSRERCALAVSAIRSFGSQVAALENVSFHVRVDDDDPTLAEYKEQLSPLPNTTLVVGPREMGWGSGTKFCSQLADQSDAKWIWSINDDMELDGHYWDLKLAVMPDSGYIVQPEFHRLNRSLYVKDERSCAPIVPNGCWKQFGHDLIPAPLDAMLPDILCKNGWSTLFLSNVTIIHNRGDR